MFINEKCECGSKLLEDEIENVYIENGYVMILMTVKCVYCDKRYMYENTYELDFDKPYDYEMWNIV